jgi:hypothetical protein
MGTLKNINVAQIDVALKAYSDDQQIIAGLTTLKSRIQSDIQKGANCPQCAGKGIINPDQGGGPDICPLCSGMGKTSGQYKAIVRVEGYEPVA